MLYRNYMQLGYGKQGIKLELPKNWSKSLLLQWWLLYEIDYNPIAMGHPDFCLNYRSHDLQNVTWIIWATRTYQLCGSLEAASFLHQLTCVFIIDNYAI